MKIGIISAWHPEHFSGGVEIYNQQLTNLLKTYYGPHITIEYFTQDRLTIPKWVIAGKALYAPYALARKASRAGLDLVISHGHYGCGYSDSTPRLHVYHGTTPGYTRALGKQVSMLSRLKAYLLGKLEKSTGRGASHCISVSQWVADEVKKQYGITSSVVPNFADLPNTTTHRPQKNQVRAIFVGTWETRKGAHLLLPIARALPHIAFDIVIGGHAPPENAEYKNLASLPNTTCHFRMPHNMLLSYYANFDVMVFPTCYEGCSLAILEALARGALPLCPPVGEGPQLFSHLNLPSNLRISNNSVDEYLRVLQNYHQLPLTERRHLREVCKKVFTEHYSPQRWSIQMTPILETLCEPT